MTIEERTAHALQTVLEQTVLEDTESPLANFAEKVIAVSERVKAVKALLNKWRRVVWSRPNEADTQRLISCIKELEQALGETK